LLNSWKEKVSFITKHNYLPKIKKNPVHKCTSWKQVVPRLHKVELTTACAHNIQLQSELSGYICSFVIKGEDKQCNNIAIICKKNQYIKYS
jgi:hypothetical protein